MTQDDMLEGDPSNPPLHAAGPQRILIVEDEVLIRLLLADMFRDAGFEVIQAATADEALDLLNSSEHIDLVATDVRMPGEIDGLGLAVRVRSEWPHIKVVIMSGHLVALPSDLADALIEKPFVVPAVIAKVRQLLRGADQDGSG